MDPDKALADIRSLINDGEWTDLLLVEAFGQLDNWLSNGGGLPEDWEER